MNLLLDIEILAVLLVGLGIFELVPALAALIAGESSLPYLLSAAAPLLLGVPVALSSRTADRRMRARDGFVVVVGVWVMVSVFGAIPYVLTGTLAPVDALFEATSGFTTTGATVMEDIEASPRALLLWRAMTQWIGGMGIVVLAVAVLPLLGVGGMQLFQAEVPGPVAGKLTPRIADTARRLWFVYLGLTVVAMTLYAILGMPLYDALCHSLTTVATGGFSTRNASIAAFDSPALEWAITFVMLLGGINFVLHYKLLTGRVREVVRDEELRFFLALAALLVSIVAINLALTGSGGFRAAAFNVISLLTTTGYASVDFQQWPPVAHVVMLMIFPLGAMAGSTAGGFKTLRLLVFVRVLSRGVRLLPHKRGLQSIRFGGKAVPDSVLTGVFVMFVATSALVGIQALLVASAGYHTDTSVSAALSAVGNVGPALGEVGPLDNFSHMPGYVKLSLCASMIAGRLEVLTVLALFAPGFWRR